MDIVRKNGKGGKKKGGKKAEVEKGSDDKDVVIVEAEEDQADDDEEEEEEGDKEEVVEVSEDENEDEAIDEDYQPSTPVKKPANLKRPRPRRLSVDLNPINYRSVSHPPTRPGEEDVVLPDDTAESAKKKAKPGGEETQFNLFIPSLNQGPDWEKLIRRIVGKKAFELNPVMFEKCYEIKNSAPGMENPEQSRGGYASMDIPADTLIGVYGGHVVLNTKKNTGDYLFEYSSICPYMYDSLYLAVNNINGVHFMNDAKDREEHGCVNDASFVNFKVSIMESKALGCFPATQIICLFSTKNIKKGQEICASYGPYYRHRRTI